MENEIVSEITDKAGKGFNRERWIWRAILSGISIVWGAYNINVERQLKIYREDTQQERETVKEKEGIIEEKNAEIVALYREISGLEDKLDNHKKVKK